jgi:hypothetical protein
MEPMLSHTVEIESFDGAFLVTRHRDPLHDHQPKHAKRRTPMSKHPDAPKAHEPHAIHEEHTKGPHDPQVINPKMASDIAYWSKEFGVTGDQLHEAIRSHGTHVEKVRAALHTKAS